MKTVLVGVALLMAGIAAYWFGRNQDADIIAGILLIASLLLLGDYAFRLAAGKEDVHAEATVVRMLSWATYEVVFMARQADLVRAQAVHDQLVQKLKEGVHVYVLIESCDERSRAVFLNLMEMYPGVLKVKLAVSGIKSYGVLSDTRSLFLEQGGSLPNLFMKDGGISAVVFKNEFLNAFHGAQPLRAVS